MSETKTVLVFPCGSEIGLEIHRALSCSAHFTLVGASSVHDHGEFVYRNHVGGLPMVDEPAFLPAFNKVLTQYQVDFIFPAHDEALVRLAGWAACSELSAQLIAPDEFVCRLCRSKGSTYTRFADLLPVPKMYHLSDLTPELFPVLIKPDSSQGSKGVKLVEDYQAAAEKMRQEPLDLILEYLPGREFTIDCFTACDNQIRYVSGRERRRIVNGISVNSVECDDARFFSMAETINKELNMRGAWFFQLREDRHGELKLLEISPRISGTSGVSRAKGVNLPLLALYDRLGLPIKLINNPFSVEIDRALDNSYRLNIEYSTVYIDLDETLIINDKVNTEAVRFLYQCINKGIRVVLVTRHIVPPHSTLVRHRLVGLFDDVVWLNGWDGKSTAITDKKAIFIDDSFAEREEVSIATGIPVFDPSAIEALLER
ncbi:MAG: ATP-grasp domain-containing protein [Planctomycetes bacterium]|nr:ATP-grasp domain-containing protein [Planctomycetota bacterium]